MNHTHAWGNNPKINELSKFVKKSNIKASTFSEAERPYLAAYITTSNDSELKSTVKALPKK